MKTYKLIVAGMIGLALSVMPVFAQRGGGNNRGGGHSTSVSRSSGGFSGSSRSSSSFSSSSRSSSYSAPRSSSSSRSYSAPRSSSSRNSYSAPRSSSSNNSYSSSRNHSSYSSPRSSSSQTSVFRGNSSVNNRSAANSAVRSSHSSPISRSEALSRSSARGNSSISANRSGIPSRSAVSTNRSGVSSSRVNSAVRGNSSVSASRSNVANSSVKSSNRVVGTSGRPSGSPDRPLVTGDNYARPGHPGVLPPAVVPIQPAPYFYCPYYDAVMYMHLVPWYAPVVVRPLYWPGFWLYCNSYWYDYHPTDVVVVREYVDQTYGVDLIAYAISGDLMYALVNDNDGYTYLQVFDQNDKLLAEQQVHRKYRNMSVDRENGGCWISKKNNKDPLLFFYTDGQLLIYETED